MRRNNFMGAGKSVAGSLNAQAYVDARVMATVAKFMGGRGLITAAQYGRVMNACLEWVYEAIRNHYTQECTEFETLTDAIEWLDQHGFSMAQLKTTTGGRNARLVRDLSKEAYVEDFGALPPQRVTKADIERPTHQFGHTLDGQTQRDVDLLAAECRRRMEEEGFNFTTMKREAKVPVCVPEGLNVVVDGE